MKLFLAAPLSGLPSDPIALGSQASRLHFAMKLVLAAPARGLPSFDTALLSHVPGAGVPCATAELIADAISKTASINRVIVFSIVGNEKRALPTTKRPYRTGTNGTSAFGARTSARDLPPRTIGPARCPKKILTKNEMPYRPARSIHTGGPPMNAIQLKI